jgi:hypothetical protein
MVLETGRLGGFLSFHRGQLSRSDTGCTCDSIGLQFLTRITISSNTCQEGNINDTRALASAPLPSHAGIL